jgi:hypothetical protein
MILLPSGNKHTFNTDLLQMQNLNQEAS